MQSKGLSYCMAWLLLQVQDMRLVSCLPIDEQGQAVLKELRALASGVKAITGSSEETDDVKTPRIAASPPAAGGQPAHTQQQRLDQTDQTHSDAADQAQQERQSIDELEDEEVDRDEL
jgi:hypothetical protein